MAKGGLKLQLVDCVCHQYNLTTFSHKIFRLLLREKKIYITVLSNIMPHNFCFVFN